MLEALWLYARLVEIVQCVDYLLESRGAVGGLPQAAFQFGRDGKKPSALGIRATSLPWRRAPEEFDHLQYRGGRSG